MPPATKMNVFLQAVRERRTNTTRVLDQLFANPGPLGNDAHYAAFLSPHHLDSLDGPCTARLSGLSPAEIAHINNWPKDLKEQVRLALVNAIGSRQAVSFFWELHDGADERTVIQGNTVTFSSPESKVQVVGNADVVVKVGP